MSLLLLKLQVFLLLICASPSALPSKTTELDILMTIKDSLDPQNRVLTSWAPHSDPCSSAAGDFEGVACNQEGLVANISLQGKGLSGRIPSAISGLKSLTGLYLHFNALNGILPKEIAALTQLTDLYLNVNELSGDIPREIANLSNLQVLQISYNEFTGGVPSELKKLKKLSVLSVQYNQLNGAIPASLGELESLTRIDLSFNQFFGPIPVSLAYAPKLKILDVRNNSLSGNIPKALERLKGGFQYMNNPGLCGTGFAKLAPCKAVISSSDPIRPEPYEPRNLSTEVLPTTVQPKDIKASKSSNIGLVFGIIAVTFASTIFGLFIVLWYRHQKLKIGTTANTTDTRLSLNKIREPRGKIASPLISLEYSNGWDPLAKGQSGYSQEFLESLIFNLEDIERATQCFSELNLLGKSDFSTVYRGILRDGSVVVVKCISKTSCKPDETEFLNGLKILASLRHENLVRLRGFCCSKSRGECFLVYDFISNGSLLRYLDVKRADDDAIVLEWSTRVCIIHGIAKGIAYLHGKKGSKCSLVHQNLSAHTVLLDARYNAVLAYSALHKLLADDIVFSTLKASAAMGYLAPEYTKTGRLTEKSDVYAFGVMVFQLLSGKRDITQLSRQGMETASYRDVVDEKLEGKFSESEAAKLWGVALLCIHESPHLRPYMEDVIQELCD
ncbi:hypothetical protein PIB30_037504 [Stylosanthes scabra]|uniref:Protein kinase domain-containing protein n=1 Tax=Stylosanthes scabra TaxID=79078 RepID=A0ABU6YFQ3_9FABA|nr:hypothetical protein [Stylosanthes scabra]